MAKKKKLSVEEMVRKAIHIERQTGFDASSLQEGEIRMVQEFLTEMLKMSLDEEELIHRQLCEYLGQDYE